MEFRFRRHFRLRPKVKNAFRSACSLGLGLLVLNTRLGLGLGLDVQRKVLITSLPISKKNFMGFYATNHSTFNLAYHRPI